MKIEGMPEGWELVRIGVINHGEWTIDSSGGPQQYRGASFMGGYWPIIRRIEPVCTWQHGVFADGWIAEDKDGTVAWVDEKPVLSEEYDGWRIQEGSKSSWFTIRCKGTCLLNPPRFRSDLPWTERIQRVGPTIEATMRGEG